MVSRLYTFEVVVEGRVNVSVLADSEDEAFDRLNESPDFPALDKYFSLNSHLIDVF